LAAPNRRTISGEQLRLENSHVWKTATWRAATSGEQPLENSH